MGASGEWLILPADQFAAAHPDVSAEDCGLDTATVLGVPCVTMYQDERSEMLLTPLLEAGEHARLLRSQEAHARENGGSFERRSLYGGRTTVTAAGCRKLLKQIAEKHDLDEAERLLAARDWFESTAERHTVWT